MVSDIDYRHFCLPQSSSASRRTRRRCRILALDPVARAAGAIARAFSLRNDPFAAEQASGSNTSGPSSSNCAFRTRDATTFVLVMQHARVRVEAMTVALLAGGRRIKKEPWEQEEPRAHHSRDSFSF